MSAEYEYAPFRLPPGTDRVSAAIELSIRAEFGGWELARLQLFGDGSRKAILRRRKSNKDPLPGLSY